ncbi:aldo/keto reductase [Solicola sp. PLA-1-18]|uniref:aldo/keto reductase n=1 Tax=Solicola sp. PLA-1-18 TaxID=3380532 RepID=UPI003B7D99E1
MTDLPTRTIGDLTVSAIGLGAMPLSMKPGEPGPEQAEQVVHAALDAGVTLIDTADAYSPDGRLGHNEEVIASALRSYGGDTSGVVVATKGGHTRDGAEWNLDGHPDYLRSACEASLRRLGTDGIGLYQHHRPDPAVPYAETMGGLRALVDAGLVQRVGISNANPEQIRQAREIVGDALVSVQNELSPRFRSSLPEVDVCAELGLAFLPWSPLGGTGKAAELGAEHDAFASVAAELDVSPQQVALAWLLGLSPNVIPIPGASRPASIESSAQATRLTLSADQTARLSA